MVDTGFFSKLGLIFKFISNNSLVFLITLLLVIIVMDLMYGKNRKETKILYIVIISLTIIYGFIEFYKPIINIFDTYITNLFRLTYFPSIIEYVSMILITILIQIISFKLFSKVHKNINLWVGVIIELLFIVNIVAMKSITVDLSTITKIYENDLLLSIFQLTGIIFMILIIYNIFMLIINVLVSKRIEMPRLNDDYE